ncbi:MAG: DNA-formamidopyrimidine glycosylase [Mycoplasmoidaceae bacterium]
MPEMPEVQTLIDSLIEDGVLNKKILDVEVFMDKLLKNCSPEEFKNFIINEKIIKLDRIGKYLIFHLSHQKVLVIHLRMEGKIFYAKHNDWYDPKHTLVIIKFKNYEMRYHDTRRFGTFHIYHEADYQESKELKKIALDPLQKGFDWKYVKKQIGKSNKHVKTAILDQTNIAGIGNIYADEILFASKIHPETKANKLDDLEFKNIAKHAQKVMIKAIANKGTTIFTYMFKENSKGEFQKYLKVHLKKDELCLDCKTVITKMKVNGRGTYLCESCQKIK